MPGAIHYTITPKGKAYLARLRREQQAASTAPSVPQAGQGEVEAVSRG